MTGIVKSNLIDLIDLIDLNCEVLSLTPLFLEVLNSNKILPFLVIQPITWRPPILQTSTLGPALGPVPFWALPRSRIWGLGPWPHLRYVYPAREYWIEKNKKKPPILGFSIGSKLNSILLCLFAYLSLFVCMSYCVINHNLLPFFYSFFWPEGLDWGRKEGKILCLTSAQQ